jgi:hypothetical protein
LAGDFVFVTGAGGAIGGIVAHGLLMGGDQARRFGLGQQLYCSPWFFGALETIDDVEFEIRNILDECALVQAMRGGRHVSPDAVRAARRGTVQSQTRNA